MPFKAEVSTNNSDFSDDEIDRMLNPDKYGELYNFNNDELEQDSFDPRLLYDTIFKTRTGIQKPEEFFNTIVNVLLKDQFKGFTMSAEDELLIYTTIINNPIFDFENEDIEERDEEIENLKNENKNITQEEIDEEVDFDIDKYEHLYHHLWEKIMHNCLRIINSKLKPRFGDIFWGLKKCLITISLL